ncbi:DESIGUAL/Modifying wall lignin-1/2, partial [Dillenia turbinata]
QMANLSYFICLFIVVADIVAGTLGVRAEVAQTKTRRIWLCSIECNEPSHAAFMLGLVGTSLLALAHVCANLAAGCICIRSSEELDKSDVNRQSLFTCVIFSWVLVAIGLPTLIIGTLGNSKSRWSCGVSQHPFVFLIGGIMCFIHGLLCLAYHNTVIAKLVNEKPTQHEETIVQNKGNKNGSRR